MHKSVKKVLFAGFLLALTGGVSAQQADDSKKKNAPSNDCVKYFYEPKDSAKALFKSVAVTRYDADDSTLANKKFRWKSIRKYNDVGQELFWMYVDSNMTVTDSSRWTYDAKHNMTRATEYNYDDSSQSVMKTKDEVWTYNDSSKITKDSSVPISKDYSRGYGRNKKPGSQYKTTLFVSYLTYDAAQNEIKREVLRSRADDGLLQGSDDDDKNALDTIIIYEKYNAHNKRIYLEANVYSVMAKEYFQYDDKDREILAADVELGDSNYKTTSYNEKGKIKEIRTYKKGILSYIYTYSADNIGTTTETYEYITPAQGSVCANDETSTVVTDSAGNPLMKTETKQKDGVPFTTTTTHKYTFEKGKMIIDTATDTEQGHLYAESSVEVTAMKHDDRGNELEYNVMSGGQYTENRRYTRKFNDHDKMIEWNEFNSCVADKPMETSTLTYFPDGERIKQRVYNQEYSSTVTTYDHEGLILKQDCMAKGKGNHTHYYNNYRRSYYDSEDSYGGTGDSYEILYEYKK